MTTRRGLPIDIVLVGAILLLPAAEWLSLAGVETGLTSPARITGAIGLAIVLCPLTALAVVLERRTLVRPVPILVAALAVWVAAANIGRPSYTAESARAGVYFGLISLTAFFASYLAARERSARFERWLIALLTFMVVVGVGAAWLERFTLMETAAGIDDRFEPLWSFFRPSVVNVSPVLGPVAVVVRHSLLEGTAIRPAGLFATPNAFADFLAVAFPLVAMASLARVAAWPLLWRGILVLFLLALLQAVGWTGSRIGSAALALELLAVPLLLTRVAGWRRGAALIVGAALVVALTLVIVADAHARPRFIPADLSLPGVETSLAEERIADLTAFTTRGHLALQVAAVSMIFEEAQSVVRGPGQLEFVRAIHDPDSPHYLGDLIGVGEGGPHSALLTFGVAGGVPAFLLFAAVAALTLWRSTEPARAGRRDRSALVLTGLALGLAGWLLVGTVDTNPTSFPEAMAIFTVIGAANGLSERRRR